MNEKELNKLKELGISKILEINETQGNKICEQEKEIKLLQEQLNKTKSELIERTPEEADKMYKDLIEINDFLTQRNKLLENELNKSREEAIVTATLNNDSATDSESKTNLNKRYLVTLVDSIFIFILAYLFVFLISNSIAISLAQSYHIEGFLKYFGVFWTTPESSHLWYIDSASSIFSAGPFASLAIAIIALLLNFNLKKLPSKLKLFLAWTIIHSLNIFFAGFIAGFIAEDGFGLVALWMQLSIENIIFISIIFLVVMYLSGAILTKVFLSCSSSYSLIEDQKKYILYQVFAPFLIGSFIIFATKIPGLKKIELLTFCGLIIYTFPMFYHSSTFFFGQSVIKLRNVRTQSYDKELYAIALICMIVIRLLLR